MKKLIISIITVFAILCIIGEIDQINLQTITLKILSLIWIYIISIIYKGE